RRQRGGRRHVPPPPPALPHRRARPADRRAAARRRGDARAGADLRMQVQHVLEGPPFLGILVGMFFANSVEPYVLGLPFAMFWVVMWVVLSAGLMAIVYRLDSRERDRGEGRLTPPWPSSRRPFWRACG